MFLIGELKLGRLYIIGNGFDLAHNLSTKYDRDLREILKKKNNDLFCAADSLYFDKCINYWCSFETRLGKINENYVTEKEDIINQEISDFYHDNSDPFQYSFNPKDEQYGDHYTEVDNAIYSSQVNHPSIESLIPEELTKLDEILSFLCDGLDCMVNNANLELNKERRRFKFSDDDIFITFNYTDTLEKLYNIPKERILHIHGQNIGDKIIGNSKENITKSIDLAINNTNDKIEDSNEVADYPSNLEEFYNELQFSDSEVNELVTESNNLISDEAEAFEKNINLEGLKKFIFGKILFKDVTVLGHSLSAVDIPYFNFINKELNEPNWLISFYDSHKDKDIVFENKKNLKYKKVATVNIDDLKI